MNSKGFLLIEMLVGLFLLGIIIVICMPILGSASYQIQLSRDKVDMIFMAQSIIEQLKSFSYDWVRDDEYLYDMQLKDLIEILQDEDIVMVQLPIDETSGSFNHMCIISKKNISDNLWEIQAQVLSSREEKRMQNVKVIAYMPSP